MEPTPRIIFLHIPKTAGQSVHEYLVRNFPADSICPARVNDQLRRLPAGELDRYRVFSGHFDWSAFDTLTGPKFIFTILRDPLERLLSFYFYLREQAIHFQAIGELDEHKPGIKAAIELSPWEYFVDPQCPLREFIDNHYDNFYSYYFAGRSYNSRTQLRPHIGPGHLFADMSTVTRLAVANLETLDAVCLIGQWQNINPVLSAAVGRELSLENAPRVNMGKSHPDSRIERLKELGASDDVLRRLDEFTHWDNILINRYRTA
ncbi:MAG: sulfotransferase family 2 domain-containing protein [Woeseiaceae bacterium]|nr:sulfotransferase family 2 domain-containing protein [Woeseiaceae bacterium]